MRPVLGTRVRRLVGVLVVLAVLAAVALISMRALRPGRHHLVADFASTTSLYTGARVKVLGVSVGRVDRIQAAGNHVRASISYDADVRLPADVHALIVPPSIVGDRFVQLAPAYTKGAVLRDDANLDLKHTGVPLELDDAYRAVDDLASALGPEGANHDGALSRLVTSAADALSGNGATLNDTIRQLAGAIGTLADSSGDASKTVTNLADISGTLAGNDQQIRRLVKLLARVGGELNSQGSQISSAVSELHTALDLVSMFVKDNRGRIETTSQDVSAVTQQLAGRAEDLDRLLKLAPVGLTSLANIYQPQGWDPQHPGATPLSARVGSETLRGNFLEDLDNQLGFVLDGLCARLPASGAKQLQPLCSALHTVGGDLGALLTNLTGGGAILSLGTGSLPTSLTGLLGGTP